MTDQAEDLPDESPWRTWLRTVAETLHQHRIASMELTPNGVPQTSAARAIPPRAPPSPRENP